MPKIIDEMTDQERQLIQCLRQRESNTGNTEPFAITVKLEDGAWEVEMRVGTLREAATAALHVS